MPNALLIAYTCYTHASFSGNVPCSEKPCADGTTCVDLAGDQSNCVPTSRYSDDVRMFVCTYVTSPYRYSEKSYQCLVGMDIMCQSICKWLQSGNNTFSFLLDEASYRICSWRAYIFYVKLRAIWKMLAKNKIGMFSWKQHCTNKAMKTATLSGRPPEVLLSRTKPVQWSPDALAWVIRNINTHSPALCICRLKVLCTMTEMSVKLQNSTDLLF